MKTDTNHRALTLKAKPQRNLGMKTILTLLLLVFASLAFGDSYYLLSTCNERGGPPYPMNPYPQAPRVLIMDGQWLVDDSAFVTNKLDAKLLMPVMRDLLYEQHRTAMEAAAYQALTNPIGKPVVVKPRLRVDYVNTNDYFGAGAELLRMVDPEAYQRLRPEQIAVTNTTPSEFRVAPDQKEIPADIRPHLPDFEKKLEQWWRENYPTSTNQKQSQTSGALLLDDNETDLIGTNGSLQVTLTFYKSPTPTPSGAGFDTQSGGFSLSNSLQPAVISYTTAFRETITNEWAWITIVRTNFSGTVDAKFLDPKELVVSVKYPDSVWLAESGSYNACLATIFGFDAQGPFTASTNAIMPAGCTSGSWRFVFLSPGEPGNTSGNWVVLAVGGGASSPAPTSPVWTLQGMYPQQPPPRDPIGIWLGPKLNLPGPNFYNPDPGHGIIVRPGAALATYEVETTTSLSNPLWQFYTNGIADMEGLATVDIPSDYQPERYYRFRNITNF